MDANKEHVMNEAATELILALTTRLQAAERTIGRLELELDTTRAETLEAHTANRVVGNLLAARPSKIGIIKWVRAETGMGLRDAKIAVEKSHFWNQLEQDKIEVEQKANLVQWKADDALRTYSE